MLGGEGPSCARITSVNGNGVMGVGAWLSVMGVGARLSVMGGEKSPSKAGAKYLSGENRSARLFAWPLAVWTPWG